MQLADFIERTNATTDIDDLTGVFHQALNEMGFDGGHAYAALSIKSGRTFDVPMWGPVLNSTYTDQWCAYYAEDNCLEKDPTVRLAPVSDMPFAWKDMPGITKKEARFMDMAREDAGFKNGMTVPIRGAMGDLYMFGIGQLHDDGFASNAASELYLLAAQFNGNFLRLGSTTPAHPTPQLSPREKQCLEWVARGKSNWEISVLLGVSERSVKDYLQSAFRKFGVHDRTQATVQAIMQGLIEP